MSLVTPILSDATLSQRAITLLGFQRTKQISAKARKAWIAGISDVLEKESIERRHEIFTGAVGEIFQEYVPIRDFLKSNNTRPKKVVDIGCGQGINDAFLAIDFDPEFVLVDIEQTGDQYHFWANEGSGYASLDSARALLVQNGVADKCITTINPRLNPEAMENVDGELVTSLYSCGFHYPVDEYLSLFLKTVKNGGTVILDFRNRYLKEKSPACQELLGAGHVHTVYVDKKSKRLAITA